MKKNNRTAKEDILIIKRGIREFRKILPGQLTFVAIRSLISAVLPYIAVLMSALILNGLTGAGERGKLAAWILIDLNATLLLSALGSLLDGKIAVGYSRLFSTHEILLTQKTYRIPYHLLEQESTRRLREQVSGSISLTGGGMASLYWDMEVVVRNLCSAAIALALGSGFAVQLGKGVGNHLVSGGEAAGILLLLAVLAAGGAFLTCKIAAKRFDVSYDVFEQGAKYQRYGEFYELNYLPDEDMAMDIRIFGQKNLILRECLQKCYQPMAKGKRKEMRALGRLEVVKLLSGGICGIAVYAAVGFLAVRSVVGIGDVLMVSSAVTMLIGALSDLAQIVTDLRNNNVHLLNYFRYVDLEEEKEVQTACERDRKETEAGDGRKIWKTKKDAADSQNRNADRYAEKTEEKPHKKPCEIVFENVSFRYPESDRMVLQGIYLKIAPGEKLAIVGENGSGKTTLIKLLCRLYPPTEGRILLNGRDIQSYPYEEYIGKLATVFQDFALFAFSIGENVAASDVYDEKKVCEALGRVGLSKKTDQFGIGQAVSHDYEEDGILLSGGEAQKVAIARGIYKAAPIVVLDEPTAALDPYAEKDIYEQFIRNLSGETQLSISHRLSSCRFCDRIAVFHGGRLVQVGTHEALVEEAGGKYAQLWAMQAQYYKESMPGFSGGCRNGLEVSEAHTCEEKLEDY